jgi:hypothetical protein
MAYDLDSAFDDEQSGTSVRRARRREQDKQRMAYRRAIEDYRDSQALHAAVCDFHPQQQAGALALNADGVLETASDPPDLLALFPQKSEKGLGDRTQSLAAGVYRAPAAV